MHDDVCPAAGSISPTGGSPGVEKDRTSFYELRGVSKTFGTGKSTVKALDRVDLRVSEGRVFGLLGPNGAGKSTVARLLLGLVTSDEGRLSFRGRPGPDPALLRREIAYLPQGGIPQTLWELRVDETLRLHGRLRGLGRHRATQAGDELLEEWALTHAAHRTLGNLSGGERQLVSFLSTLIGDRSGLILDEPTDGVDAARRGTLWRQLRRLADRGRTVVLITHNLAEAQLVLDEVAIIFCGRVRLQGDVQRVRSSWLPGMRLGVPARTADGVLGALAGLAELQDRASDGSHAFLVPQGQLAAVLETLGRLPSEVASSISLTPPTIEDIYRGVTEGREHHG